ncbi:SPV142 ankyrin repeat protein [Swinepox virus]|uniref:SPV142 ankyrin repeat protein n=1 Tax=Swinepox virus (strain Swine/Nebraska/17077-99/1999) TaxID=300880 RepID=Q8V3F4_SWPV1|nr:ankyrin repeat protein [Swinepox virus]AAL69881.1 SPV142 ankyrin repeat protein [Swinepox virus]UED36564.1 ankyrin repeat protein [Swinepox virus]UED36713.1 ankyrin repeat protein [Swinepox virus]UUA44332.1 SPV142 [Swinepox virus]
MVSLYEYISYADHIEPNVIRTLLTYGYDINEERRGSIALTKYLKRNFIKTKILKLLIQYGSNVNYRGYIETPLCCILRNTYISSSKIKKIVKILVENGADINMKTLNGVAPIMCFIYNTNINNVDMLRFLILNGVDMSVKSTRGFNLLHMYLQSFNTNTHVVKILIEYGVNLLESNTEYYRITPMNIYLRNDASFISIKLIKYLMSKGASMSDNDQHESVLESFLDNNKIIMYNNDIKILNFILKYIKVNHKNSMGFTPILISAKVDNYSAFNYFLMLGDSIYNASNDGDTVLTYAVRNGNHRMVDKILELKPGKHLIRKTFTYFSEHGISDIFFNEKKMFTMLMLMHYSFMIYPIFYKNCIELKLMFPHVIDRYEMDLSKMKNERLHNSTLSIYDIIFNREDCIVPIKLLNYDNFLRLKNLVMYGSHIENIIKNTYMYYSNIDKAIYVIMKHCKKHSYWMRIPIEIQRYILLHLTMKDLSIILK